VHRHREGAYLGLALESPLPGSVGLPDRSSGSGRCLHGTNQTLELREIETEGYRGALLLSHRETPFQLGLCAANAAEALSVVSDLDPPADGTMTNAIRN